MYVLLIQDRHCDPIVKLFTEQDDAVTAAKEVARTYGTLQEEPIHGWIYHARFSPEGDSVRVTEETVDEGKNDG